MKNSEQAFLAAYDEYADALFRYCYARLGERERAKDAVQETFHRAWKWLLRGNVADNMRALLYRMATNITIDEFRRPQAESLDVLDGAGREFSDAMAPDPHLSARISEVVRTAQRLDPKYRDPLLMRYVEDMPVKEIASILDESVNTTSVRIHRGLAQLKMILGGTHDR